MGMPSCGQCHCNMFIDLLLTCTITNTIINDSLASPPCASSLAPFSFPHPPTPVLSVTLHLKPNLVEEDWWKGFIHPVHHPSPCGAVNVKLTTPTHPIDYWVNTLTFYLWWHEHPQESISPQNPLVFEGHCCTWQYESSSLYLVSRKKLYLFYFILFYYNYQCLSFWPQIAQR